MSSSNVKNFAGPAMLIAFCLCCSSSSLLLAGPFSSLLDILKSFFEVGGDVTGAAGEAAAAAASGAGDLLAAATGNQDHQPMSQEQMESVATDMQGRCFSCAPFGDEKCNETKTSNEQAACAGVIDATCTQDPSFHEYCPTYTNSKPDPNSTINLSTPSRTASERAERDRTYTAEECFQCIPLTKPSNGGIECSEIKIKACKETVTDTCRAGVIDPAYRSGCRTFNKMASAASRKSQS